MTTEIMAVMNLTPDSFSDGGQIQLAKDSILRAAQDRMHQGADWLDLGGESTRPGATPVTEQEELDRVLPALEAIKANLDVRCSIDTSTPRLMREAAALGADMINDVRALTRPGAVQAASDTGLPVVLMHMQGTPESMQANPTYRDVEKEVFEFLAERVRVCIDAGLRKSDIALDPGFGFGKTLAHNKTLFLGISELAKTWPVLIGVSRKRMIAEITGQPVEKRDVGSAVAAALAARAGARWVRVHNVEATRDALAVMKELGTV